MAGNEHLRLFVAIPVPETVRNGIIRVQGELRDLAAPGDVRWTSPEQFHLTMKFLGNIPAHSVEMVKAALVEACTGIRPFPLCAKGIGFFPNARSPRVIWAGFEDQDGLNDLHMRVEKALAPFAEKPTTEKFLPHTTLGRFQKFRRHKTEKLLPRALSFGGHMFGEWRVDEIHLMRSALSPSGSRHTLLMSVPLAK